MRLLSSRLFSCFCSVRQIPGLFRSIKTYYNYHNDDHKYDWSNYNSNNLPSRKRVCISCQSYCTCVYSYTVWAWTDETVVIIDAVLSDIVMSYIDIEHLFVSFIECNDPTDTLRVRKIHYSACKWYGNIILSLSDDDSRVLKLLCFYL
jgi:hypothetical protein